MADPITKVAVLAANEEARARLEEAAAALGLSVAYSGSPGASAPVRLQDSGAQAWLVALDAGNEQAMAELETTLHDSGARVLYEDVDVLLARSGWDQARWLRHLAVKLGLSDDLLPAALSGPEETLTEVASDDAADATQAPALELTEVAFETVEAVEVEANGLQWVEDAPAAEEVVVADMDEAIAPATDEAPPAMDDKPGEAAEALAPTGWELEPMGASAAANAGADESGRLDTLVLYAGIGGPDAVRQLLGALPAEFDAVILLQQQLGNPNYERLAEQMQRASALPVVLAGDGKSALRGHVNVMPEGMGLAMDGIRLAFSSNGQPPEVVLPANGSTFVVLSGAGMDLAAPLLAQAANGASVLAQSAQTCYDSQAAATLIEQGVAHATPQALGEQLATAATS